ncbi:AAA family ATPase [Nakamurella endophytica]|uniref:ATPase AAA-type core domain-containing protein n=1 Tax=Nakamurella endophytica TaxID=1748367 RepID=A0A917TDF3_9ACTN|nr:ATP-binding protein [Nakamurella endophytica]GGM19344.1 hypothetical protein GCM10011594_44250 [Nakamurella endophytica]
MPAELLELRLPAFKSVRDGRVRLGPLTLIVGRNGSGKSNVLDALAVLSSLSAGLDLREALDGRDRPAVRGGSQGCAPLGTSSFKIGVAARYEGAIYQLDLRIGVEPILRVEAESLWTLRTSGPKRGERRYLLKSEPPDPYSADIVARWDNGQRGTNPPITMRADQLLTSQIATRVPQTSQPARKLLDVATSVLDALSGVFVLDPVPSQMREYVPERDSVLRRSADNLSAVVGRLIREKETGSALIDMTRSLSEAQVADMRTVRSPLGDVMAIIEERIGGRLQEVPTRLMSDGTLRFLAIAAAMHDDPTHDASENSRLLVVEELENGLHSSQSALLINRLKEAASRNVRTLATTHSPVILDSLGGADHAHVVVAARDEDGWSRLTRLTDFPNYLDVLGRSSLGRSVVTDRLRPATRERPSADQSLVELFGA